MSRRRARREGNGRGQWVVSRATRAFWITWARTQDERRTRLTSSPFEFPVPATLMSTPADTPRTASKTQIPSNTQGFHCLQNGAFNNSRCLRGARTVPSATESGNSVGFSRRASCDTTPESPWARDVGETKSARNTRFARCVIRLNPACNRIPHRVGTLLFRRYETPWPPNQRAFI